MVHWKGNHTTFAAMAASDTHWIFDVHCPVFPLSFCFGAPEPRYTCVGGFSRSFCPRLKGSALPPQDRGGALDAVRAALRFGCLDWPSTRTLARSLF